MQQPMNKRVPYAFVTFLLFLRDISLPYWHGIQLGLSWGCPVVSHTHHSVSRRTRSQAASP